MGRAGETAAAKTHGRHSEIAAVFLDEQVARGFRRPEERMLRVIDAHGFGNSRFIFVARLDLPAFLEFAQRKTIGRVAVDFVGRTKDEWRFRAKISRGFEQIERAVGVNGEIDRKSTRLNSSHGYIS